MKTHTGASLIPVWHCDFIPCLHEGTLHVDRHDCDTILNWISNTAHLLPITDYQVSDFMLERTAVLRLHDIRMCFRTGMKISLPYSYWGELAPVWLAPLWDFVLVSCKWTQSHKKELVRSELVLEWKSHWYHVNTPSVSAYIFSLLFSIHFLWH